MSYKTHTFPSRDPRCGFHRSEKSYDQSHITKPSQISFNIPVDCTNCRASFIDQVSTCYLAKLKLKKPFITPLCFKVSTKFPGKGTSLIVVSQELVNIFGKQSIWHLRYNRSVFSESRISVHIWPHSPIVYCLVYTDVSRWRRRF